MNQAYLIKEQLFFRNILHDCMNVPFWGGGVRKGMREDKVRVIDTAINYDMHSMSREQFRRSLDIAASYIEAGILKIDTMYMNNCKIAHVISQNEGLMNQELPFEISKLVKNCPDIFTYLSLVYEGQERPSEVNVTKFDSAVMDAVYTLIQNGYEGATTHMIYRVMSGNLDQLISPEMERKVEASIDKLRRITIKIMCKDELDAKSIENAPLFESSLFPCVKISVRVGNRKRMSGYLLYRNALYLYAESLRQIIAAPFALRNLDIPMKTTDDVIIIKDYIIQRIEIMKHVQGVKGWNRISLEWYDSGWGRMSGLLPTLGYTSEKYVRFDNKRSKIKRIITSILDCFARTGYIKGYEKVTRVIGKSTRGTVIGYDISVDREKA